MPATRVHPMNTSLPDPRELHAFLSPQIVIAKSTVLSNIDAMIAMVGGDASQLRPHLKTHKSEHITRLQIERGITTFKASTLGEVAMAAKAGATSVLLAHQPVGPKVDTLLELCQRFPECCISVILDCPDAAKCLDTAARAKGVVVDAFIDVDCGMHRTGIAMGDSLDEFIEHLNKLSSLRFAGLHVYDGHLHQPELQQRQQCVDAILADLRRVLEQHSVETVIVGGTPTYGVWVEATHADSELTQWRFSPGTSTLWDWNYGETYAELPFQIAAAVLTRVISKPTGPSDKNTQLVCFDLGYKAIASEMPMAVRMRIGGLPEAVVVGHSEEHLVVAVSADRSIAIGDPYWAFPRHVCPTVARYDHAILVGSSTKDAMTIPIAPRA